MNVELKERKTDGAKVNERRTEVDWNNGEEIIFKNRK